MTTYHHRYAVWIADPRRRADYPASIHTTRAAAESEARRRNRAFLRDHQRLAVAECAAGLCGVRSRHREGEGEGGVMTQQHKPTLFLIWRRLGEAGWFTIGSGFSRAEAHDVNARMKREGNLVESRMILPVGQFPWGRGCKRRAG